MEPDVVEGDLYSVFQHDLQRSRKHPTDSRNDQQPMPELS